MELQMVEPASERSERIKKFLGIFFLAVAILCLVSGVAIANPSSRSERIAPTLAPEALRFDSGEAQNDSREDEGKGLLSHDLAGDPGGNEAPREVTLRTKEPGEGDRLGLSAPYTSHVDAPGYKTKTHLFMTSRRHPGPALLLIEERSSNGELYLGLLSLAIPW